MPGTPRTATSSRGVLNLESPDLRDALDYELSRRKRATMRMSGSSMKPAIEDGDLITIVPARQSGLRTGDVVVFTTESGTVLVHRLVRITKREGLPAAIARGDYSQTADLPFPLDRVIGHAISVQKRSSKKVIALGRGQHLFARFFAALRDFAADRLGMRPGRT